MLPYVVPPRVTIKGPDQVNVGSNITVQCKILEGYPLPSVYIITPRGQIDQSTATFNVTLEDAGNYTCFANNSLATVTSNLSLTVNGMIQSYVAALKLMILMHNINMACTFKKAIIFMCFCRISRCMCQYFILACLATFYELLGIQ